MEDKLSLIESALQRLQTEGGKDNFCIFTASIRKNYYIQFRGHRDDPMIWGEAVSNEFLASEFALSEAQMAKLQELGWNRPSYGPDASPNFYQDWEITSDEERQALARLILHTLQEVYGLLPEQPLVIDLALE